MQERTVSLYPRAPIYFLLVFLVAIIGFYPSFFSKLRETDAIRHFHGLMATAWMLMLIAQGWLMRQRKFSSHRAFGKLSFFLAPLFIASGFLMIHSMLASTNGFSRTFGARLAFVDIATIPYWWSGPDFTARHEVAAPRVPALDPMTEFSSVYGVYVWDVDRDGCDDLVTASSYHEDAQVSAGETVLHFGQPAP